MTLALKKTALVTVAALLLLLPGLAFGQSTALTSADKFFSDLSAAWGKVKDYEGAVTWTRGKEIWTGKISYKTPMYLHVDFTTPAKMVLNFDGETLTFYYPANSVILQQSYKKKTSAQVEAMVSSQALGIWQRNYSIAYLSGPAEVPLEDGSREMVVKLKLVSRAATSYTQMIVSVVNATNMIRRVEGTLTSGEKVVMDLTGVKANQNIPDARFQYDGPADASVIPDWLFDSTEE
jgi:outer membrane lipoprotein-sorting protein